MEVWPALRVGPSKSRNITRVIPFSKVTPLLSFQNLKVPLLESFEKNNALTRPSARFLAFFKSPDSSTSTSEAPSDRWTFLPGSLILHDISGS